MPPAGRGDWRVTDVHVHMQPWDAFRPETLARMRGSRSDFGTIEQMSRDASILLRYLDSVGIDRALLINYPAPDIMGFGAETNDFAIRYVAAAPDRLLPVGGVHPRLSEDPAGEVERLADAGIRALKIHPPHMVIAPNEHIAGGRTGEALAAIYETASRRRLPVIIHTGTSVFPGARSRLGDPIGIDDVMIDFPDLTAIMAHGGRPIWMQTCFFLMRRHPNLWLDLSGIPPRSLPDYFPRLESIASRTLFGSDWPSPGVKDIGANADAILALPDGFLSDAAKKAILQDNALKLFPPS